MINPNNLMQSDDSKMVNDEKLSKDLIQNGSSANNTFIN